MLLLMMVFPLFSLPTVPIEYIALMGRLASAALVMLLFSMILLSFPALPVVVLKNRMPEVKLADEALIVQYFTVSLQASLMKRIAEIPADIDVAMLVFVITRSFVLPVAFNLPSMVTLLAPFRSMRGADRLPLMLNPLAVG